MPITPLPTPPSRANPANFANEADAFLGALPTFQIEANALQADVNAKQIAANNSAIAAAASELAANSTANASAWVSGTTYAIGDRRYDTTNWLTYRRKTAGAGTTRPGLDTTNWQLLTGQGDAVLTSNQTWTGNNTFTQPIAGSITGNAATATTLTDTSVLLPPGIVVYMAHSTNVPTGWLRCNGATVSRTTYAALYAQIGNTWGAGNGSTTFHLPDFRGVFLRGLDDGRLLDPSRVMGIYQNFAQQNFTANVSFYESGPNGASGIAALGGITTIFDGGGGKTGSLSFNLDASRQIVTSYEVRPVNHAVVPLIKY